MKLSIVIFATVVQQVAFAASFTAATVASHAFTPQQVFRGNLSSILPPVQLEAMLTLLSYRPMLSPEAAAQLLSGSQQKAHLLQKIKTKRGYQKLLDERSLSVQGLAGARVVFSLDNIWKINLSAVMPHSAKLTDEDFPAAADFQQIDFSTWAVLDLVAMGHQDIVTSLSSLDYQQIKNILINAVKNWHLAQGEESLLQLFSEELTSKSSFLQEKLAWNELATSVFAEVSTSALAEEVAAMEKIAALAGLVKKADAVATFYAERACADQNCYKHDEVVAAAIDDLSLDGYVGLAIVSSLMTSYDGIAKYIAQEIGK